MNKLTIKIIFLIYISLSLSCSYEPLYSGKTYNFGIEKINFEEKGEKNANTIINNKFKLIKEVDGNNKDFRTYTLLIKTSKIKKIVSKDSKGDPVKFELVLTADFKIIENEKILLNKKIERKNIYNNKSDKFKLEQTEKIIIENLARSISDMILSSIIILNDN